MKPYSLLLVFAAGGFSVPSQALPPVVNTAGGYPQQAPAAANAQKTAPSNTMYEILNRLEQLQSEVQTLTGKVEEQAYQNAELKKRLSTMYSDFDERMQNVENKLEGPLPPAQKIRRHRKAQRTVSRRRKIRQLRKKRRPPKRSRPNPGSKRPIKLRLRPLPHRPRRRPFPKMKIRNTARPTMRCATAEPNNRSKTLAPF